MAKAIGYTRVSTDEQVKHGSSLGIQNKDIAEYCKTNNIELVEMFEDAGVSGGGFGHRHRRRRCPIAR